MVTFGNSRCAIPSWLQVSLFRTARSSQGRAVGAEERTLDGEDRSERIKQPGNWTRVGVLDWVKSREHAPVFFGKRRHTLVTTIRSISLTVFFVISDLLFFHLIHNHIQFVETLFPESAIANRPVADCLYCLWPKRAHALSSTLRLDHNPRPHQVGNMF